MAQWSRRDILRAGVALSGSAFLAACGADAEGGGAAPSSTPSVGLTGAALEEAARAEGAKVTWYQGNQTLVQKVTEGFKAAYPWMTLDGVSVTFNELTAKLTTEALTNAPTADVIWTPPTLRQNLMKNNLVTSVVLAGDKNMPADTLDKDNIAHPIWQLAIGILHNPAVVSDPPATPQDLANSKWKGKIAFDRVANLGQSTTWLSVWKGKMGDAAWNKWLDDVKAQDIFITPTAGNAYDAVLKGERQLAISSSNYVLAQAAGTPVAMSFKIQPVPFYNHQYLIRRASHPASAKLFMEWASTADGQKAVAEAGLSPIMAIDHKNAMKNFLPAGATLVPGTDLTDFATNTDTYANALSQRWPS